MFRKFANRRLLITTVFSLLLISAISFFAGVLPVSIQEKFGISSQAKQRPSTKNFFNPDSEKLLNSKFTFGNTTATVTTDRADYQIGDTVYITGSGFWAGESVKLQIVHYSGSSGLQTSESNDLYAGHDPWFVTADALGNISSSWYVDPDDSLGATFLLTADGQSSLLHAEHTFTDNIGVNLDQCQNISLLFLNDPCGTTPTNQHPSWVNGNANGSNSQYREGDGLPYRSSFTNIPSGTWVIRLEYDFTKGGIYAIDRLTRYNLTQAANPCLSTNAVNCNVNTPAFTFEMPGEVVTPSATQPALASSGFLDIAGTPNTVGIPNTSDRNMTVWVEGGTATFLSTGQNAAIDDNRVQQTGLSTGDSSRQFAFKFTLSGCPQTGCDMMLGWTGHIASAVDWGPGKGARSISGSPFHMRILGVDQTNGTSGGNQDRSMAISGIVQQTLTVNKVLIPSSDPGRFNLQIDGATAGLGANVGDGGSTGIISVTTGNHTVGETAAAGTNLSNYTTIIDCGSGPVSGTSTTVNVADGANVVCTITNTLKRGSVTLVKNVIGKDVETFPYAVTGLGANSNINITTAAGTGSVTFSNLPSGTKTVDEGTMPAGWSFESLDCSDPDNGTTVSGDAATIDLDPGEDITCTYVNRFTPPKLTVIKHVINDNGGTKTAADFTMTVTATNPNPSSFPGSETGTEVTLDAGAYSVSETELDGYEASYSADCTGSIANGESKTCTVTNDDIAPKLIVIKHVVNDNGGSAVASDFTLDSGGTNDTPDNFAGAESPGTEVTLDAGNYNITETGPSGYTASYSADCEGSIDIGETKTCTVTNDDDPAHLIVIKHVINDNGGTAVAANFTMTVNGVTAIGGNSFAGAESPGTDKTLSTIGDYDVTETGPSGYAASYSADCTGTIALGETKTCTVTNDDIAPKLTVIKHVINDNGGTKTAANFTMTVTATNPNPSSFPGSETGTEVTLDAGAYSVSETELDGYEASYSADCTGSIAVGETKTCTVTNDDQTAHLKLVKVVVNDNGGEAAKTDFTLSADGPTPISGAGGAESDVNAGTYALSETEVDGYTPSEWSCEGGTQTGASIKLALGESAVCTITNDDETAHLKLVKVVINDSGGTAKTTDFTLSADGPTPISGAGGAESDVNAGSYALSESSGPGGYTAGSWSCVGGTQNEASISLALGESAVCTINNDDIPPKLHLRKVVINDHGGQATTDNFTLTANGSGSNDLSGKSPVDSGAGLKADTFALSETTVYGYTASNWVCEGGSQSGSNITVGIGGDVTCTITNDDQPGTIVVIKNAKPAQGSFAFTTTGTGYNGFTLTGATTNNGNKNTQNLSAGTYTVKEATQLSWFLTGIGGSTDPNTPYDCVVTGSGGSTGVGNLDTQTASISLKNGDTVTCTFENTGSGATRTQGFWQTHPQLADIAWNGGSAFNHTFPGVTLVSGIGDKAICGRTLTIDGFVPAASGNSQLLGGFWSAVSKTSTNAKRSALDQARMQLMQQLLAAELNASAFGSVPAGGTAKFAAWETALCGTNQSAISKAQSEAASFNSQGDNSTFTPGTSADSKNARMWSDIPFWDIIKP